jgi:neutral ceramidase
MSKCTDMLNKFLLPITACITLVASAPAQTLSVGGADVDITPPPGNRMAGYFDERIATGTHDPLHAKALVLRQGQTELALVFCDLLGLSLNVTTNARARASALTGIPVPNIMISATHSHTGPLFDDIRETYFHQAALAKTGADPHRTMDYPAWLTERLVQVITEAQTNLRPAELSVGITTLEGVAFNRRYWMTNGTVHFNPGQLNPKIVRPAGPVDPRLGILLAREPGANLPFAGLTVFGLHSDTAGGALYSADYEYYLEQTLQGAFGSNYLSAFGLGPCGDINHVNVKKKETTTGYPVSERIGSTLGKTVLTASADLCPLTRPSFAVRDKTLIVPLQIPTPEQLASAQSMIDKLADSNVDFYARVSATKILDLAERGRFVPMEVQVFRFDADTALVCLPGEIFTELGMAIKHDSPFKYTFVMSVCNDRPSYVPTRKAFKEGSYEVTNSRVQPGSGEKLVKAAVRLLKQLKP